MIIKSYFIYLFAIKALNEKKEINSLSRLTILFFSIVATFL